jgi:hypothetical protein
MVRILLSFSAALAACTPSAQETAMPSQNQDAGAAAQGSTDTPSGSGSSAPNPPEPGGRDRQRAAMGPVPEPVSAENTPPAAPADTAAEAEGRRTLSTAYVRVGPDGHLTVELRGGRVLVLRDVALRPKDYCGVQVLGGSAGARYCGGYAEVAAARPGGAPAGQEPDLAIDPSEAPRNPEKRD